ARYNPLFIHGGSGMGKTHLLNAAGNAYLQAHPGMRVRYGSAEEFTEELITAIQEGMLPALRARYRSADVLLLDDVQSLAGRERTQEEFFHVFNELHASRRQILVTSDRAPGELEGVEERLVSRFSGGLVVEISPLDERTAAGALLVLLGAEGFALDEELADELAHRLQPRNMREIQGQAKRASIRAEASGMAKDAAFLRRILLRDADVHVPVEPGGTRVDPFFTDPYKVARHWEPLADRLRERLA
nr:ATP-binding protein [Gemmatimonadota bacterium]